MPEAAGIRAFLAVPADPGWSEAAGTLVAALRAESPPASWTRPAAWHITVKFLGTASRDALESFGRAIEPLAASLPPGELSSEGAAVFPSSGPARVLAIGFAPGPALESVLALASAAETEARRAGLEREDRAFRAHVTLARLKDRWRRDAVDRFRERAAGAAFPAWPVRTCVLYASRLDRTGAIHTPIAEWRLAGAAVPALGASA